MCCVQAEVRVRVKGGRHASSMQQQIKRSSAFFSIFLLRGRREGRGEERRKSPGEKVVCSIYPGKATNT